jgi:hypothetical protein
MPRCRGSGDTRFGGTKKPPTKRQGPLDCANLRPAYFSAFFTKPSSFLMLFTLGREMPTALAISFPLLA